MVIKKKSKEEVVIPEQVPEVVPPVAEVRHPEYDPSLPDNKQRWTR